MIYSKTHAWGGFLVGGQMKNGLRAVCLQAVRCIFLCNRHLFLYVCLETVYVIYVGTVVVLFQGLVSNFVVTADFGAV